MQLMSQPYRKLVLLMRTDELMAAGMPRRWAKIAAVLWLLEQSLKNNYHTS